jgi:hypothetical protein
MLFTSSVLGQGSGVARVVEVIPSLKERAQALSSCVKVVRQFMDYVRKKTPDIAQDEKAQVVYLTRDLKKAMAAKKAFEDSQALKNPGDKREYPDNGAFVGAWDYPSTYSIVGSRTLRDTAVIDVLYTWGKGTDYEGNQSLRSFIFRKEGPSWRLDDIYIFSGAFESAESLKNYFRQTY